MSSTPRNAMGSRQTVSSELTPREFHPNCRSDRAALIACGGLVTARTVAGREYHCPLCGSWRNRELPDIFSRYFPLAAFRRVMAYRCTRLCLYNHKENVFGEWLFGCQRAVPFSSYIGKLGESFLSSHPVADGKPLNIRWSQNIF